MCSAGRRIATLLWLARMLGPYSRLLRMACLLRPHARLLGVSLQRTPLLRARALLLRVPWRHTSLLGMARMLGSHPLLWIPGRHAALLRPHARLLRVAPSDFKIGQAS